MNAFLQSVIGLYDYAKITGDSRARGLVAGRRARGRARGARLRRGRLVALQLPRSRVRPGVPRAAARVPGLDVQPPADVGVLHHRTALPRLPDRPRRARPRRARPPPPRTSPPASASSSTSGRRCRWWSPGTAPWGSTRPPPSAAARARSSGRRAPPAPTRSGCPRRSCAPARACAPAPRARGGGAGIGWGVLWRLAPSSTRARAASARRASPRPLPGAAPRPA